MPKAPLPLVAFKDNLLLKEVKQSRKSPGGIELVESKVKDPYRYGEVLAKGPGLTTEMDNGNSQIPDSIKIGDIVLFHQAAGWDIKMDGTVYVIVSWRQIETMINPEFTEFVNKGS